MYADFNFKTKKALKEAVKIAPVPCHQAGPFGSHVADGKAYAEGPHYPEAHKWYASVVVSNGHITKVTG